MKRERCIILVDGSNFYFKLRDLGLHTLPFRFSDFSTYLCKTGKIVESCYYIGKIRQNNDKKSQQLFNSQQKLLGSLKKHEWKYKLGYLLKSSGAYHEKGVDVQIAVDIVVAAYQDRCDRILLISSDTDILPAVEIAKQKGKIVEYVGFSHKPSVAMVAHCSESTLLKKGDLQQFI